MTRQPSVTSQLSQLERTSSGKALRSTSSSPSRSVFGSPRQSRQFYAPQNDNVPPKTSLKYWRDISWPSFLVSTLLLVLSRLSHHASTEWTVNQYNHVLYRKPFAEKDTVPTWSFIVWIVASSVLVLGLEIFLIRSYSLKARIIMGFNGGLALLEGFFYTVVVTELGKIWIGEPRPDYVARCIGSHDADATFDANGVIICTEKIDSNARESFPSGHSSSNFACGVFLAAYFVWVTYYRRVNLPWRTSLRHWYSRYGMMFADAAYVLCIWPVFFACYIAGSRVVDNRHSPADITAGAVVGTLFGLLAFARLLSRDHASLSIAELDVSHSKSDQKFVFAESNSDESDGDDPSH